MLWLHVFFFGEFGVTKTVQKQGTCQITYFAWHYVKGMPQLNVGF